VERLADAVAFMHLGTLAELGPLSPLLEAYGKWHLRVEDSTRLVEAIRAIRGVTRVDVEGDLVAIWSPIDPTQAVMNVVRGHGTAIRQWSFAPATLEDIWSHAVSTHSAVGAVPDAEG
jgi:ABC-2 type transport system ATP-binding protein